MLNQKQIAAGIVLGLGLFLLVLMGKEVGFTVSVAGSDFKVIDRRSSGKDISASETPPGGEGRRDYVPTKPESNLTRPSLKAMLNSNAYSRIVAISPGECSEQEARMVGTREYLLTCGKLRLTQWPDGATEDDLSAYAASLENYNCRGTNVRFGKSGSEHFTGYSALGRFSWCLRNEPG